MDKLPDLPQDNQSDAESFLSFLKWLPKKANEEHKRNAHVYANIGRTMQKMPDTTIKAQESPTQKLFKTTPLAPLFDNHITQTQDKIGEFATSLPGELVRSWGGTVERSATPEGRSKQWEGAKKLPSQIEKIAFEEGKRMEGLGELVDNPALEDALNATDLFTLGAGTALKTGGKQGVKQTLKTGTKEVIEQGAKTATKEVAEKTPSKVAPVLAKDVMPDIPKFEGFSDLTTNVLEKLKGSRQVPASHIEGLTKTPGVKKGEIEVLNKVLSKYLPERSVAQQPLRDIKFSPPKGLEKGLDKPVTIEIPIAQLTQSNKVMARTFSDINKGEIAKTNGPIDVWYDIERGQYLITDGNHRVAEALKRGENSIKVNLTSGLQNDYYAPVPKGERYAFSEHSSITGKPPVIATRDTGKIPVKQFAEEVQAELLPLTKMNLGQFNDSMNGVQATRYESVNLPPELRGNVANYTENIYRSPIKTSAGNNHFGDVGVDDYFAHTRVEDLARGPYESIDSIGGTGSTRRVIEIQSDLFQKGRLQQEASPGLSGLNREEVGKRLSDAEYGEYESLMERNRSLGLTDAEKMRISDLESSAMNKYIGERKEALTPLKPYENTWHERVIREEVKKAAEDGKTKLQFPVGETAMKIEGLGEQNGNWRIGLPDGTLGRLTPDTLKVGQEVDSTTQGNWIITDVLGDGKFKAVTKGQYDSFTKNEPGSFLSNYGAERAKERLAQASETFDISGKIDTSNPIYKFYESEVGKYLSKKYGAKRIKDPQGVEWWEVDVTPEQGRAPIEAFGVAPFLGQDQEEYDYQTYMPPIK